MQVVFGLDRTIGSLPTFLGILGQDISIAVKRQDINESIRETRISSIADRIFGCFLDVASVGFLITGVVSLVIPPVSLLTGVVALVGAVFCYVCAHDLLVLGSNRSAMVGLFNPLDSEGGFFGNVLEVGNRVCQALQMEERGQRNGTPSVLENTWVLHHFAS